MADLIVQNISDLVAEGDFKLFEPSKIPEVFERLDELTNGEIMIYDGNFAINRDGMIQAFFPINPSKTDSRFKGDRIKSRNSTDVGFQVHFENTLWGPLFLYKPDKELSDLGVYVKTTYYRLPTINYKKYFQYFYLIKCDVFRNPYDFRAGIWKQA